MTFPAEPEPTPPPAPAVRKTRLGAFLGWLRARFFAGMVIALPVIVTFWILRFLITEIDRRVVPLLPHALNPGEYLPFAVPGLGLIILVVFLTLLGVIATNLVGRIVVDAGNRLLSRVPVVNSVYSVFRQITDVVASNNSEQFEEVVLVEYPRKNCWSVGFITNPAKGEISSTLGQNYFSVFVPTTPNPTSGFVVFVHNDELRRLALTIEEGVKIILTAGIVIPEHLPLKPGEAPLHKAS